METKQARLQSISDDYDWLFRAWKEGDLDDNPSVALEILETRRQNVEALSTWPYRLMSVGKLALGSIVSTAIPILESGLIG